MDNRARRNNNPGNLRYGDFARIRGAADDGDGYAKFPTLVEGVAALVDLLASRGYRNLSIKNCFLRYAPKQDNNDPDRYAKFVAERAGVSVDTILCDLHLVEFVNLVLAIAAMEGFNKK